MTSSKQLRRIVDILTIADCNPLGEPFLLALLDGVEQLDDYLTLRVVLRVQRKGIDKISCFAIRRTNIRNASLIPFMPSVLFTNQEYLGESLTWSFC